MPEFKLPDVGEGLTEAEIVTWKVQVGDVVKVNDIVVEIETAKSLVELPTPYAGTVQALMVPEGETVAVGTPIIAVGDAAVEGAVMAAPEPAPAEIDLSNPAATGGGENQTLVGYGPRAAAVARRPRRGGATPATEAGAAAQVQLQGAFEPGGAESAEVEPADEPSVPAVAASEPAPGELRALAAPPVRKLARDLGIDLRSVTPTGRDGVVTRRDVEAASTSVPPRPDRPPRPPPRPPLPPRPGARPACPSRASVR